MIADAYTGAVPVTGVAGVGYDPYAYDQGRMQQCCNLAIWILLSLLLLGLLIWLFRWLTTPTVGVHTGYHHNLISSMHHNKMD